MFEIDNPKILAKTLSLIKKKIKFEKLLYLCK